MSYAEAFRSGSLGESMCPQGQVQSCLLARPGQGAPPVCTCVTPAPQTTTAVMTQAASTHWGLIAAGVIAGLVIYKFVL